MKQKVCWLLLVLFQAWVLLKFAGTLLSPTSGARKGVTHEYVVNVSTPTRDLPSVDFENSEIRNRESAAAGSIRTRSQEASISPRVMTLPETFLTGVRTPESYNDRRVDYYSDDTSANPPPGPLRDFERDWFDNCEPDFDHPVRPTCNSVHELDASRNFIDMILSMDGNWRSVLRIDDQAILKVLHLHREFDDESYRIHEMDNAVMEHLTGSPHIVSSYGFCGQSVITPFARNPGKAVVKDKSLRKIERLKLARNLARGLAELHAMQRIDFDSLHNHKYNHSIPAISTPLYFAHHDINIANTISIQEKSILWNDFNLGIYSKHLRIDKDKSCDVPIRYSGELWRSPEEIRNSTNGVLSTAQPCDVYSFGNILFHILVKRQPWTHLEDPPEPDLVFVGQQKAVGKLPNLPEEYIPKDTVRKVIWKATKACFRLDPATRPTALQLAEALHTAYEWSRNEPTKSKIKDEDIDKLFDIPATTL